MFPLDELSSPEVSFSLRLTLRTCAACLVLHAVTAVPLARWSGSGPAPLRRLLSFLITLPLVFPPIALGFMLLMFFGHEGWGGRLLRETAGVSLVFSRPGIIFAAWLAGLPLVVKPVQAALGAPELKRLEEAARVCGAGPLAAFLLVTLPLIRRGMAAGLLLGLTRALGEVGMSLMLGGNIAGRTNTLSLEIFNSVSTGEYRRAAALCLLLGLVSLLLYLAVELCQNKHGT